MPDSPTVRKSRGGVPAFPVYQKGIRIFLLFLIVGIFVQYAFFEIYYYIGCCVADDIQSNYGHAWQIVHGQHQGIAYHAEF